MVTFNIIERVFLFRNQNHLATGFTYDVDHRRFIVTAKHAIQSMGASGFISILKNGKWQDLSVDLVGHAAGRVDISVLTCKDKITADHPIQEASRYFYGEDVYFLGYPYGDSADYGRVGLDLPVPFIKKAIISQVQSTTLETVILLDGHNNPGFSGGPVVRMDRQHNVPQVISVVSGYRIEPENVYDKGGQQSHSYNANTGIILTYAFRHARDIMVQNAQKGLPLDS